MVRPDARPAGTRALDSDGGHNVGEAGAVVAVAAGEHEGQGPTPAVTGEVSLGSQSTSTSSEGGILWFVCFSPPPLALQPHLPDLKFQQLIGMIGI